MADKRKAKLKRIENKMKSLQEKYPNIDLSDSHLQKAIKEYEELSFEHFHLKFEIEHCPNCSQVLPEFQQANSQTIKTDN